MSDDIAASATRIEQLDKDSQGIGSVLGVIRGIAEQTNLLALNAALKPLVLANKAVVLPWSLMKFAPWHNAPNNRLAKSRP